MIAIAHASHYVHSHNGATIGIAVAALAVFAAWRLITSRNK